jgi:hypothetical protein
MKINLAIAAAAVSLAAVASPAAADIIFVQGGVPGNLETINLNASPLDNVVPGTAGGFTFNFLGTENIVSPSEGQARIEAATGTFDSLFFSVQQPGTGFTSVEFNINAATGGGVKITAHDQFGEEFENFVVSPNGQNFFNLYSINGQIITDVLIQGTTAQFADIRQLRVGGITPYQPNVPGGVVPEPATWGLMILGFGGVGAMLRTRRRTQTAFSAA